MINEEVRSRHNKLVEEIRADIKRIQRIKNAAPQMLAVLKSLRDVVINVPEEPISIWFNVINDTIQIAEGNNSD